MSCGHQKSILDGAETPEERIARRGGRKAAEKALRQLRRALKDRGPEAIPDIARTVSIYEPWVAAHDLLAEVWFNNILSGPVTHMVNFLSNTSYMLYRPLPQAIGAFLRMDLQAAKNAGNEYIGMLQAYRDVLSLRKFTGEGSTDIQKSIYRSWKTRESHLMSGGPDDAVARRGKMEDSPKGFAAGNWIIDNTLGAFGLSSKAIDSIGDKMRIPTRALQAGDELSKQVAARARTYAKMNELMHRKYAGQGKSRAWIAQRVEDNMRKSFVDGVALTKQKMQIDVRNEVISQLQDAGMDVNSLSRNESMEVRDMMVRLYRLRMENQDTREVLYAVEKGIDRALDISFTKPLADQDGLIVGLGKGAQNVRRAVPPIWVVIPFVQTPTNILKASVDHSPVDGVLGALEYLGYKMKGVPSGKDPVLRTKFANQIMHGDADEKADAIGRFAIATATSVAAYNLATNWMDPEAEYGIVGSPPRDYRERAQWENEAKVQFNSVFWKNEDGTRSYLTLDRLEPFSSFIGVVADIATAGYFVDPDDEEAKDDMQAAFASTLASLTNNFVNKSYASGLQDFMETMLSGDGDQWARYLRRTGASVVVPNALTQAHQAFDPMYRDEQSFMETLKSRSGFWDTDVSPKRNALGEVRKRIPKAGTDMMGRWVGMTHPFKFSTNSRSVVDREFARLGEVFSPPKPNPTIEGVSVPLRDFRKNGDEFGQTAFDRWQELAGTIKNRKGKTLREALAERIRSDEYKALAERSPDGMRSEKAADLKSVIRAYRREAMKLVVKEYPEIITYGKTAVSRKYATPGRVFPDAFKGEQ